MSNTKQEPIRKVRKYGTDEEEYFLCPSCNAELEHGEQIIDAMIDDVVPAGESEVYFMYCPECGWDNEHESCDKACSALGGLFWY